MRHILDASESKPLQARASFTLSHRIYRLVWNVAWVLLASWTPPFLRRWRCFLLNAFGARIATTANIYSSARIWYPPNLRADEYACIGPNVMVYSMAPISLGAHALVSQGAHLCCGTHDIRNPDFQLMAKPIVLGASSWVAAEAFVGPGVIIGVGAVLGARGVTFSDLDPWTIYVGNPATSVGHRNQIAN